MLERLITLLHVGGWILGTIYTILFIIYVYFQIDYEDSIKQKFDSVKGIRRYWPFKRALVIAAICWSTVYITW